MSIPITARANVAISKGRLFTRNRYELALYIEDVYTGLHWHVNRKQAKVMPQTIINNAGRLLEDFGLMEPFHALLASKAVGLPVAGDTIKLAGDLGKVKAGLTGTVTSVAPSEGVAIENDYPVLAKFNIKGDDVEIALNVSEFEVVK